jgi:AcrR family transcriptional regulator
LESARALMINQGVGAVTIRGVARAAGISPGNLGYHFANYDELLHSLMEWVLAPYLKNFAILRASVVDDPIASLRAVINYVLDDLSTEDTTMFFPELWVLANRDQRAAVYMQELYDTYMKVLEEIVAATRPDLATEEHQQLSLFICTSIEGQTVFVGYQRPYVKHQHALKRITMDVMISAVVNHVGKAQTTNQA